MANLIIGDFRSVPLQQYQRLSDDITLTFDYLVEDTAEYSWFSTNAAAQLPLMSLDKANIIIMLGFNDCVYSCVWKSSFNINTIVNSYADTINKLIEQYPSLNFYISSVNPVDLDYPFAPYKGGVIPAKTLTNKIKQFNKALKSKCKAEFIDCFNYLNSTGFDTRDGVRYKQDICSSILSFIKCSLKPTAKNQFIPRLVAPVVNSDDIESDIYWVSNTFNGGLNPFSIPTVYTKSNGDTLPNCTSYAWGRFYEITEEKPKLSTGNAELWYANTSDSYRRGATPALGAIACWEGIGTNTGFVAVVEKVNSDGSIETSESMLGDSKYWWLTKRTNSDNNWGADTAKYKFQGFIYCPAVTPTASMTNLDKTAVISKPEALTRAEMEINARYIWNYLGSRGWSLNAVAGMLGNMQAESTINPGRHQVGGGSGFGLVQWTPSTNLTDWCAAQTPALDPTDMDSQLEKIINEKDTGKQYIKNHYKYNFKEFITSLDDPYTLACAFAFDYERSDVVLRGTEAQKEALRQRRGGAAEEWYTFLAPYAPTAAAEDKFILDSFKLDSILPTKIKASCIVRNGDSGNYLLLDSADNIISRGSLGVSSDKSALKVVSFSCDKKLKQNTSYTLRVEVVGAIGKNTITKSIKFTTPTITPESAKSIKFSCNDKIKSVDSIFTLNVEIPNSISQLSDNAGYDLQLVINNKCVKTKTIKNTKSIVNEKFTILDKFEYNCKTGDTVQIGIRTWIADSGGQKTYDSYSAKTSVPICLLNSPIQTYLTVN